MINILIQSGILILGFAMLIKGAGWFVDGAVGAAAKFGIPHIVIGLTVVAIGTSLPEASVSIASALKGNAGITIGNVLGSNIMNVLLILGITSIICSIPIGRMTKKYDIPLAIIATAGLAAMGLYDNHIERIEGFVLLAVMVAYIIHLIVRATKEQNDDEDSPDEIDSEETLLVTEAVDAKPPMPVWKMILLIIVGIAMISLGSDLTVDSATVIATIIGIDQRIIGLTIVAFGTSLPELVTSIAAALKGNTDISVGNIVGSNIFNILFVAGSAAAITPIDYKSAFALDSAVALFAVVLLYVCVLIKPKLNRISGVIMVLCYGGYLTAMLMM